MWDKSHDVNSLNDAQQRLGYSFDLISDIKKQLETSKTNMLAKWHGDAARAFGGVVDKFNANLQDILNAQQTLAENIGMARMVHEDTAAQQQEMVNTFESLLNN